MQNRGKREHREVMSHPEQFGMEKGEAGKQQKLKDGDLSGK